MLLPRYRFLLTKPRPASPPAAKRGKAPMVSFVTKWDALRRRYIALDDSGVLLGMSHTKGLAMGIARTAAINGAKERGTKITVMAEGDDEKLKKQWTFAPPTRMER